MDLEFIGGNKRSCKCTTAQFHTGTIGGTYFKMRRTIEIVQCKYSERRQWIRRLDLLVRFGSSQNEHHFKKLNRLIEYYEHLSNENV